MCLCACIWEEGSSIWEPAFLHRGFRALIGLLGFSHHLPLNLSFKIVCGEYGGVHVCMYICIYVCVYKYVYKYGYVCTMACVWKWKENSWESALRLWGSPGLNLGQPLPAEPFQWPLKPLERLHFYRLDVQRQRQVNQCSRLASNS